MGQPTQAAADVAAGLAEVRERIAAAARAAGRDPAGVTLVAVSKTQPRELAKAAERQGRRPRLLIQVNTGEEPQKSGVLPAALPDLVGLCRDGLGLPLEGLMAIPPEGEDVAPHAALLAKLARRHGLPAVSVGMSADFETAVRFGATQVRVGTLIFGARAPRHV
jgi:uncharacterized pyridoxal phosphate-containing UPF0001 family protein